jgi:hypothetical protein
LRRRGFSTAESATGYNIGQLTVTMSAIPRQSSFE